MESAAYNRLKAAWVSSNAGSTMEEPLIAMLPLPLMIVSMCLSQSRQRGFICEFIWLILPIVVQLTALAHKLFFIPTLALLIIIYFLLKRVKNSKLPLSNVLLSPPEKKPPWITNFRACIYLLTIICILAVDLNIFPRKFAKTETFGFGAMDLGVGFFMVCNGLVKKTINLKKEVTDISILIALGSARLVSVWLVDYQEHITEYGLHWNFFFTLALCRLISATLERFLNLKLLCLALSVVTVHHAILTSGVQDWVLGNSLRITLISANREGLVSTPGYVAIYYFSSAYRQYVTNENTASLLKKTLFLSIGTWAATHASATTCGVSRRLCNIGYILWTLAMASSISLVLIIVDVLLRWARCVRVPSMLTAINANGLFFFLLGNIVTGLINIRVQTLLLSTLQSYFLLLGYMAFVTYITINLHKLGITF